MPGRDRRVSCEDDFSRNLAGGFFELQTLFLHAIRYTLQRRRSRCAPRSRASPSTQCAESTDTDCANAGAAVRALHVR